MGGQLLQQGPICFKKWHKGVGGNEEKLQILIKKNNLGKDGRSARNVSKSGIV